MATDVPKPRRQRKRSPRPLVNGGKRKHPGNSEKWKALWADPEWRERTLAAQRAGLAKVDPAKNYRRGVPDGMRKAEAEALWAKARAKAQELHQIMVDNDLVAPIDDDTIPLRAAAESAVRESVETLTDEQKGSLALREAMVMVLSPLSHAQTKNQAIRTVLEWTKSKPPSKTDVRVNDQEAWLEKVVKDAVTPDGDRGAITSDA